MTTFQAATLHDAVDIALKQIDTARIHQTVPELVGVNLSAQGSLTAILLDPHHVVVEEAPLLELMMSLGSRKSGLVEKERDILEERLSKAEVRHTSRDFSTGALISSIGDRMAITFKDGPSTDDHGNNGGNEEYIPLIGLALGRLDGPIKNVLDNILLSRIHRSQRRIDLSTRFLRNLLKLWKEVLIFWMGNAHNINPNHASVMASVTTEISDGKKRARSLDAPESSRAAKRFAYPIESRPSGTTTPSTRSNTNDQGAISAVRNVINSPHSDVTQTPATWPPSIRNLLGGLARNVLPPSGDLDIMEIFDRREFSKRFGGATGGVWSAWNKSRRLQNFPPGIGQNAIIATYTAYQPFAPSQPCLNGLLLEFPGVNDYKRAAAGTDEGGNQVYTVIMQCQKMWRYCGEYRLSSSSQKVAWEDLSSVHQCTWIDRTYADREKEVYKDVLKSQVGAVISKITIQRAFTNGHIQLQSLLLECVAYHKEIQRAIISMNSSTILEDPAANRADDGLHNRAVEDYKFW